MKTRVLIAALVVGGLLCCGIISTDVLSKETLKEAKGLHYQNGMDPVKIQTFEADAKFNPARMKTPKLSVTTPPKRTVTPTPAPTIAPKMEPTTAPVMKPTVTASPTPDVSGLYKLRGVQWDQYPVRFYIDPAAAGVEAGSVIHEVEGALESWDAAVEVDLVESAGTTSTTGGMNGRNEVFWTTFTNTGTIGTTTVYYTGDMITEADIKLNSNLPWGVDADGEGSGDALTDRFDVRNIVTHEAGHAFGLGDLYETSAVDLTMYGYSTRGQVKKISLGTGDIAGIRALYGS